MAPAKMSMQKKRPNGRIMSIGPRYALSTTLLSSLLHGNSPKQLKPLVPRVNPAKDSPHSGAPNDQIMLITESVKHSISQHNWPPNSIVRIELTTRLTLIARPANCSICHRYCTEFKKIQNSKTQLFYSSCMAIVQVKLTWYSFFVCYTISFLESLIHMSSNSTGDY